MKQFLPLLALLASSAFVLQIHAQTETPAPDPFLSVSQALVKGDLNEARALLQTMKANGLEPTQHQRWENLAARTAVRLGDKDWLAHINSDAGLSQGADEVLTIAAMRMLFSGRLIEAKKLLDSIEEPERMQEIPRRRFEQLNLKIAQLEGDEKTELQWAQKLVEFVGDWDSRNCQSCHANPKAHGKAVTNFDARDWWVGERYMTLLKSQNAASNAVQTANAALAKDPTNEGARLQLAYAYRALNEGEKSEAALQEIPWVASPGPNFKKPLRFGIFP